MRLIDAEGSELQTQLKIIREAEYQIYGSGSWGFAAKCERAIEDAPTVQLEIVRCGDGCKFWDKFAGEQKGTCYILRQCTSENFYCGNAKRRER